MAEPVGRLRLVLMAVFSGALLGLAYPPVPFPLTAFIGFLPFFALMGRMRSAAQAFRYGYLTFLVLNLSTVYWISGWWGNDPWLKAAGVAVNLVHPLLFTVPTLIYYRLRGTIGEHGALFAFPFVWAAFEWAFHLPELSFPWLPIGNTLSYSYRHIQFIEYTGLFGVSFFVVLINVLLWRTFVDARRKEDPAGRKRMRYSLSAVFTLLVVATLHSFLVLSQDRSDPTITIGIAQPDIDPYEKWSEGETPTAKVLNLMALYDSIAAHAKPDVIVFPETAFPFYIRTTANEAEWDIIRARVDSAGIPLLTGFADLVWYDRDAPPSAKQVPNTDIRYATFNSSMWVEPRNTRVQVYHKSRLTPLSERIPYVDTFPFLADLLTWGVGISSWGLGNDTTVFDAQAVNRHYRTWAMICYETLYPDFVAGFVRRGANVLGVITNDGWFGNSSGPYQLQQYAALRAMETRRAIYRCANNGISCFIDPYGRVTQKTTFGTRTWIVGEVPIRTDQTFYTVHGDWLAQGCAVLIVLAVLFGEIQKRKRRSIHDRSS